MPELKIKNRNKVHFYREFVKEGFNKERFNFLPLTMDEAYLSKKIIKDKELYLNRVLS